MVYMKHCLSLTLDAQQFPGVELLEEVGVEAAGLDGQMVQLALLVALVQNVLLDGALRHQAVDVHLPRLPNSVAPVLGLEQAEIRLMPEHVTSPVCSIL